MRERSTQACARECPAVRWLVGLRGGGGSRIQRGLNRVRRSGAALRKVFEFFDADKNGSIDRKELSDGEHEVADALEILGRLHTERNQRPVAETITRLLDTVRAHAGIAIWPNGEQALANCLHIAEQARRFERRSGVSFRAFVEELEEKAAASEGLEAPLLEEGTEGVRIMTVHKAKGLEFPVVILADPTCNTTGRLPSHFIDEERRLWAAPLCGAMPLDLLENEEIERIREEEEAVRIAYVAATRARDLLGFAPKISLAEGLRKAAAWYGREPGK